MNKKYVIAVSGGVDSMYLANLLASKNQAAAFVHINHHTRGVENDHDAELVTKLGAIYNLPVYIFDFIYSSGNFQSEAREFRYQKLTEIASNYDHKIAVAHHLDDQLENSLLPKHLVKSNLMAYRSKYQDCYVYRPLLGMSKGTIYQQAEKLKIEFNEDVSNQSDKYMRNKNRIRLQQDKYQLLAKKNYIVEYNKPKSFKLNIEYIERSSLMGKPTTYRLQKLYQLIKSYDSNLSVKNRQLTSINRLIDLKKNSKYSIANCVELFIGYDKIYMLSSDENIIVESALKVGQNEFNGVVFESELSGLRIRTWKQGDRVEIANGHKKVSRIFIDNKVESHMRKYWPLIINSNGEIIEIPKLWRKNEIN